MNATDKVRRALSEGKKLTPAQIAYRYKVVNPRDVIYALRGQGYDVKSNNKITSRGRTVVYSL